MERDGENFCVNVKIEEREREGSERVKEGSGYCTGLLAGMSCEYMCKRVVLMSPPPM